MGKAKQHLAAVGMSTVLIALSGACKEDDVASVKTDAGLLLAPTWHSDVAPILIEKCSGCHAPGRIAPFSLRTYAAARPFADQIVDAVVAGRMPPFLAQETEACSPRLPWSDDLRLSPDEKALLRDWAAAGAPEGEETLAAPVRLPERPGLAREDLVMKIPEEFVISGSADVHRCVIVDPGLDDDAYVVGRMVTAGNNQILHHVVSYILKPGANEDGAPRTKAELEQVIRADQGVGIGGYYDCFGGPGLPNVEVELLDAWAPGGVPNVVPPDSGQPLDKDALVLLDMHYHPTGAGTEKDSETKLSLMLADEVPAFVSRIILIGNFEGAFRAAVGEGKLLKQPGEEKAEFIIPAGAHDHVEEMTWTWKLPAAAQLRVFGMGTHMHYVGRDMRIMLEHGSDSAMPGTKECLIQTPAWDFNWQRGYWYDAARDALPLMVNGDRLRMRCVFDNSMDNPFVRDALRERGLDEPVEVPLGEDTLDEMCLAGIGIMYLNIEAL